ncbi:GreA/GreB family elongation factor [Microbacterium sp. SD291]|uniref:GreA/GreB family elongation factor n=1 Tax=Microbacterium sp. SD291 TaxID=2782007 RepID=UPI001A962F8C|nr:GreA/GreB family elongation factor [Microbacterium sp. SD291]MBO0981225.1 GreA/GreB family elongation factor [Microbacterium sp. SD291]
MTADTLVALEAERATLEANESALSQSQLARLLDVRRAIQEADTTPKPNDGLVEDGMLVTVEFDDGESETFVLVERELGGGIRTVSVSSPIGRALAGRRAGDVVDYSTPSGARLRATITAATPYSPSASAV